MNKTQNNNKSKSQPYKAYSLLPKDGGYAVMELILQDDKLVAAVVMHEPDVMPIALSVASRELRKAALNE